MAELLFKVRADYDEAIACRNEVRRLEAELKSLEAASDIDGMERVSDQLVTAKRKLNDMCDAAAKAAAVTKGQFRDSLNAANAEVLKYQQNMYVTKQRIEQLAFDIISLKQKLTSASGSDKAAIKLGIIDKSASIKNEKQALQDLAGGLVGAQQRVVELQTEQKLFSSGIVTSSASSVSALKSVADASSSAAQRIGEDLPSATDVVSGAFQRLRNDALGISGMLMGGLGLEQLIGTMIQTRGEFQQTEMAFDTMLGDTQKSQELVTQLINTAAKTPFDMQGITNGAKQLLAYGTSADEVNDTLVRLGDIAAGLSLPLGDLVYLYGTTMTQGRLYTQDLRQFMGRGIPLAAELAKQFGVAESQVGKLVTDGKVGADQVKKAIESMTSEGGRFGGLMEKQAATFVGRISNIEDAVSQMFNEMGKSQEGVINEGIDLVGNLVENWQTVGKVILTAIAAVGTYKASLIAAAGIRNAQQKAAVSYFNDGLGQMDKAKKESLKQSYDLHGGKTAYRESVMNDIRGQTSLKTSKDGTTVSLNIDEQRLKTTLETAKAEGLISEELEQEILKKKELLEASVEETRQSQLRTEQEKFKQVDSQYTNVTEELSTVNTALANARANKEEAESIIERTQNRMDEIQAIMDSADASSDAGDMSSMADEMASLAQENATAVEQRDTAATEINTLSEKQNTLSTQQGALADQRAAIQKNIDTVSTKGNTLATQTNTIAVKGSTLSQKLNSVWTKANATAQMMLTAAVNEVKGAFIGLKAALMSNPITAIATIAMTAVTALSMFSDEEQSAAEMSREFGDSASDTINKVNSLYAIIKNTDADTKTHKDALSQLTQVYEDYGIKLDENAEKMVQNEDMHKRLTQAILNQSVEQQKANAIQTAADNYKNSKEDLWKGIQDDIDSDNANVITATIRTVVPDEDLVKLGELNQKLKDGKISADDYAKGSEDVYKRMLDVGKSFGLTSEKSIALASHVLELASSLYSLDTVYNKNINTINKAADSVTDWSDKNQRAAYVNKINKMSVDELLSATEGLIKEWNNEYHLNLKIHYDDSEIPQWMKNLTDKELQDLIARRWADIKHQKDHKEQTGRSLVTRSGGRYRTMSENQRDFAMARSLADDRKAAADAKQKEKEKKEAEAEKNKNKRDAAAKKAETERNKRENARKSAEDALTKLEQSNVDKRLAIQKDGLDKELEQLKNSYDKRLAEIKKQEDDFKDKNKKAGTKTGKDGLTEKQSSALVEARNIAKQDYDKQVMQARKEELASMRDYIKSYGSLMQQREAIEAEYNEKIENAKYEGEKLSLRKEKEQKLASFEFSSISKGIDWKALLGGVGNISTEMLKPMLTQLEAYTKTDQFQNADTDTQQKTVDLINELRQYVGDQSTTWEDLSTAMKEFNDAVTDFDAAVEEEKRAKANVAQAKADLDAGGITQEQYDAIVKAQEEASEKAAKANENMRKKGSDLNDKTDEVKNYSSALTEALNAKGGVFKNLEGFSDIQGAVGNIDALKGAFDAIAPTIGEGIGTEISGTIGGVLDSIGGGMESILSSGIGQTVGFIAMIPKMILQLADAIKNFVTGILDSFTELLKFEWLSDLVDTILDAVWNLIDTILDLPENIFHMLEAIVVKGVGGLVNNIVGRLGNILSFGALSSGGPADWFQNSNAKQVAEKTEKLTKSNENLQKSVDNLKNELSKQSGWKAIDTARTAKEDQQKINEQTMEILRTQMAYHGAHRSNAYYWNLKSKDYDSINETLSRYKAKNPTQDTTLDRVGSLEDIYKLTPEQMDYIRTYNLEQWKYITDAGKYDKSEYWENYADLAGQMEEIADSLKEALTGTTFDNMRSNFVSELMDMSKTAQDFSDSFSEMLMQSVLNAKISDIMDEELQDFYKKWAEYAESDNVLDDAEIAELKQEYQGYVQKGMELRDQAAAITGYDGTSASQNTSSNTASSMTQDQASELNGRFTALQIAGEKIVSNTASLSDGITTVNAALENTNALALRISGTADEMRTILANLYLEVRGINENTSMLVKYGRGMNENIEKIKENTKNL